MSELAANHCAQGILLAGGSGSRLHPLTAAVSKQLLPVYDKPLVYYGLSTLLLAGIRRVLLITTPHDRASFERLLGDGSQLGIEISYTVQPRPQGIAQALLIGRDFIGDGRVALVLGDNIFYGPSLQAMLQLARARTSGATVFAYPVKDPERYGVVELDVAGRPLSIVEKPAQPKSRLAVTGLYFYDERAVEIAAQLAASPRGELEITDVNRAYLALGELFVERFNDSFAWFDAGAPRSLLDAANFVRSTEEQHGVKIGCPEGVAYQQGFIDATQLRRLAAAMQSDYGRYLSQLADAHVAAP